MSDLSRVLGDLYGEGADADQTQPTTTAESRFLRATAPEWADESRLDDAFAGWTPGPPADAPAAEREMSVVIDAPLVPAARLDEDLAATLSAALVDAGQENEVEWPTATAPSYSLPGFDDEPPVSPAATYMMPVEVEPSPSASASPEPAWEPEPELVAPVAEPPRAWSRADDDIIPGRVTGARAPKVKAPKGTAKGPKLPSPTPKAKAPKEPKLKKEKGPKAPKPAKASSESPKKFLGIELTLRRTK